jgi:hypothetical protein
VIPRIITEKESARQVTLHFQAVPARIPLIYVDDQNRAFIMKSDTEFIHLEPGGYLIKMDILRHTRLQNIVSKSWLLVTDKTVAIGLERIKLS